MKSILLFADVGGHDDQKYYHVGDEAMLYENYRWYRQHHPDWAIAVATWSPSDALPDTTTVPHLLWPKKIGVLYIGRLFLKALLWRRLGLSFFTSAERAFVESIQSADRVHFTGGGNMSSQFRHWLYYSYFVLYVCKLFGKEVILTSQTLGPLAGVDRIVARVLLNMPRCIAIRSSNIQALKIQEFGIVRPKILGMLDAAYSLPAPALKLDVPNDTKLVVGLSLHAWGGWEDQTIQLVVQTLTALAGKYTIAVVIIPHHLVEHDLGTDAVYMKHITRKLPKGVFVYTPSNTELFGSGYTPAEVVKGLTSQVDLLISTRYHGIIFGLSQAVPTIALTFDAYYQQKNSSAMDMFYGTHSAKYQVAIDSDNAEKELLSKVMQIVDDLSSEKASLQRINSTITSRENTLNTILLGLEH